MPDIAMCRGLGCPSKHRCYRAMASPDPVAQSWADYDKLRDDANPCGFFWDISADDDVSDNGLAFITEKD